MLAKATRLSSPYTYRRESLQKKQRSRGGGENRNQNSAQRPNLPAEKRLANRRRARPFPSTGDQLDLPEPVVLRRGTRRLFPPFPPPSHSEPSALRKCSAPSAGGGRTQASVSLALTSAARSSHGQPAERKKRDGGRAHSSGAEQLICILVGGWLLDRKACRKKPPPSSRIGLERAFLTPKGNVTGNEQCSPGPLGGAVPQFWRPLSRLALSQCAFVLETVMKPESSEQLPRLKPSLLDCVWP